MLLISVFPQSQAIAIFTISAVEAHKGILTKLVFRAAIILLRAIVLLRAIILLKAIILLRAIILLKATIR